MPDALRNPCTYPGCPALVTRGRCQAHGTRLRKPCAFPGCSALVRGGSCEKHGRPTASARGYNGNWRKLREMVIRKSPICADPFKKHTPLFGITPPLSSRHSLHVDHIIPKRDGGTDHLSNLQVLCHSCHSVKTLMEKGK